MDAIRCTGARFSPQSDISWMREGQRPRPPNHTHRQSLSGASNYDDDASTTKNANDQSQSLFFQLPTELRRAIYAEVGLVDNTAIHCFTHPEFMPTIGKLAGRIYGKLCTLPRNGRIHCYRHDAHTYCSACGIKATQALDLRPESFVRYDLKETSPSIVPLLQTCRRL